MIDPDGLLGVARDLATIDKGKPRGAALRRAVSTAYYALFHFLIRAALEDHVGAGDGAKPIADRAARWFDHGKMRGVCDEFVKWADAIAKPCPGKPPAGTLGGERPEREVERWRQSQPKLFRAFEAAYPKGPSPELRMVANCFLALHAAREAADYDPVAPFTRESALANVDVAKIAFDKMAKVADDPLRRFFLLLLLTTTDIVRER